MTPAGLLDLILNSFLASFVFPLEPEINWFSWLAFYPDNMLVATLVALAGSILGLLASYGIGWIIAIDRKNMPVSEAQYQRATRLVRRYLVWLFLVPWVPFLPVLALVTGFLRVSLLYFLPLALLGRLAYYSYYLTLG